MLLFLILAAGIGSGSRAADGKPAKPLRVAAAADLQFALQEIVDAYKTKTPELEVRVSYGSSGNFFAQISNGAPFDLYLSADMSYPRKLVEAGLALKGSEFSYAIGRLVVWVPKASKLDVAQLGMKTLRASSVRRIAIANPEHAPYGIAAVAAMHSLGVYGAVQKKLVFGENVAQAAQFVQSGNADVGILPLSLALAPTLQRDGRYWQVPENAYPRMDQGGVVIASSSNAEAAKAFSAYIIGAEGRAILERYGFRLP
jgi:molybdate transport system substrate-binding protein